MQQVFDIAILGASGYTGAELVRLIATHPGDAHRGADRRPQGGADNGRGVSAPAAPRPAARSPPSMRSTSPGVDLVFCALPHATTQEVIATLPGDLKIVDLSADFRLRDPAVYDRGTATRT